MKMSPEGARWPVAAAGGGFVLDEDDGNGTAVPRMSVPSSPVAGRPAQGAQSPISLLLAVANHHQNNSDFRLRTMNNCYYINGKNINDEDDDLTNLSWLHQGDILKGIDFRVLQTLPDSDQSSCDIDLNANNTTHKMATSKTYCDYILTDEYTTSMDPANSYTVYFDESSSSISVAESSNSSSLNSPNVPPNHNNNNNNNVTICNNNNTNNKNKNKNSSTGYCTNNDNSSARVGIVNNNNNNYWASINEEGIKGSNPSRKIYKNELNCGEEYKEYAYKLLQRTANCDVYSKPPYSFSGLIFMAIDNSETKALPVKDIYQWITQHFPYFKTAPSGWKNSVRHNLSLNRCFRKLERAPNLSKGSLWMIDEDYRPSLIQTLSRSPYYYNSCNSRNRLKTSSSNNTEKNPRTTIFALRRKNFQQLKLRLRQAGKMFAINKDTGTDNENNTSNHPNHIKSEQLSDADNSNPTNSNVDDEIFMVATALLALRNNALIRKRSANEENPASPKSEDHTYSVTPIKSSDGGKCKREIDGTAKRSLCRRIDFQDSDVRKEEEYRELQEGARTLMVLATSSKRVRIVPQDDANFSPQGTFTTRRMKLFQHNYITEDFEDETDELCENSSPNESPDKYQKRIITRRKRRNTLK